MLRGQIKKGDLPKAQMVANQMAHYRNISDRNFAESVSIQTQIQMRCSNHKIHQAHMEAISVSNHQLNI